MSKSRMVSLIGILMLVLSVSSCKSPSPSANNGSSSSAVYDKVVGSSVIRCGYITYPPGCIKDANTGRLSGIFVEALEKAGENLGLKVEWVEEVGWGSMIEGLETNRYDLIGSPVWSNSSRGKLVGFTTPLFYSGIGVYIKKDDNRFTGDLQAMNSEKVKVSTIDGEMSDIIARTQFPKASRVSLAQLADNSQMFLDLVQGRSDVVFAEPYIAEQYLKNNANVIKNIAADKPIRLFGNCMMFRRGQVEFKSMLDTALSELINNGYIDQLLDKYSPGPNTFYRVAYPYNQSQR
jgi:ABC-type amino acid transport substrate-binding protein